MYTLGFLGRSAKLWISKRVLLHFCCLNIQMVPARTKHDAFLLLMLWTSFSSLLLLSKQQATLLLTGFLGDFLVVVVFIRLIFSCARYTQKSQASSTVQSPWSKPGGMAHTHTHSNGNLYMDPQLEWGWRWLLLLLRHSQHMRPKGHLSSWSFFCEQQQQQQ